MLLCSSPAFLAHTLFHSFLNFWDLGMLIKMGVGENVDLDSLYGPGQVTISKPSSYLENYSELPDPCNLVTMGR